MTDSPTYPRYPSQDDVPEGVAQSGATAAPGQAAPHPAAPTGYAQPLGLLTALTVGVAALYAALLLPRFWLAQDAVERWERQEADGGLAWDLWTPYELVDAASFPVLLGAYVITCLWLWRVRSNLEVLSPTSPHARRRGWVWGGWLVPIVSLWFPYQVVRDALRVRSHRPSSGARVGWWWGAFLLGCLATGVESVFVPVDEIDTASIQHLPAFAAATTVLFVVACALWIRVVRAIAADQAELLAGTEAR